MSSGCQERPEVLGPLELELQVLVSCLTWVLRTEPQSLQEQHSPLITELFLQLP